MAILKGFPPSNTIETDRPMQLTCELCGSQFWQSFPLTLHLSIDSMTNFGILPCRKCYEEDQGGVYWGNKPNKWGDGFHVYSKVREGYTTEELTEAYNHRIRENRAGRTKKHCTISVSTFDRSTIEFAAYRKMTSAAESPWYDFDTWYAGSTYNPILPTSYRVVGSKRFCDSLGSERVSIYGWDWLVEEMAEIPDSVTSFHIFEQ